MKWIGNVDSIVNTGKPGKCPLCGSENTDYKATITGVYGMGILDVWCNDCLQGFHIEPARFTTEVKTTGTVPKNLRYGSNLY